MEKLVEVLTVGFIMFCIFGSILGLLYMILRSTV